MSLAGRIAACALALATTLSAAQDKQTPDVRVTTHLVQIAVAVRARNGQAPALTKDDFTVLDRGQAQKISVFSQEHDWTAAQMPVRPPQNTFSDRSSGDTFPPRSVTVVLLDNLNTLSGAGARPYENTPYWLEDHALAAAKQHLVEFLQRMDENDRIAIYSLTDTLHVLCDFTCTRAQLLQVVGRYDTTARTMREVAEPGAFHVPVPGPEFNARMETQALAMAALNNGARAQITMAALIAIAAHLADIPGRKNLLWLTANLPFSGEAVARILDHAHVTAYPVDARGLLPRAATDSVDSVMDEDDYATGKLGRPPAQSDQPVGIRAMQQMAAETGGIAFVNSNDLTGAIRQVVEDAAITYTLGFYVDAKSLDGKFHQIKVQVSRPGLSIRYARGYFAFKDTPASQHDRRNSFLVAIRSPLNSSAIPLDVQVSRMARGRTHVVEVLGSVGLEALQVTQAANRRTGALDVYLIEQDIAGHVLHQSNNQMRLNLTEQQYQAYLRTGIEFRQDLHPQTDATVLRVVVQDPVSSEVGSVIIPLAQVN